MDSAVRTTSAAEDLAAYLAAAVEAAHAAGEVIRNGATQPRGLAIERKTVNDFVSEIDKRAEQAIIERLSTRFPDHAFKA